MFVLWSSARRRGGCREGCREGQTRPSLPLPRRMSWMLPGTKSAPMGRYLGTNSTRTSCIRMTAAGGLESGDPEPFRQPAGEIGGGVNRARVTVEGEEGVKGN